MSEPIIEVGELVKPVSDAAPGGVPLPDDLRRNLDAWRKETDPDFPDPSAPPPEWGKVIDGASTALAHTGKDLVVAARLVEALTKKHAAAGLRDGLALLTGLAETCWEHVHPLADGEDQEARRNRLEWLNNAGSGGKFPDAVLRMPVVGTRRGERFAVADWMDPARRQEVLGLVAEFSPDGLRQSMAELRAVQGELTKLGKALDAKMGSESPNFTDDTPGSLGHAVNKCLEFVRGLADAASVSLDDAQAESTAPATGSDGGGTAGPIAAAPAGNRDGLYRQLEQLAAALKRIEPHSPVPYLLERCVRLGRLPFPDLMREVIRETTALDELDRLLGLQRASPPLDS